MMAKYGIPYKGSKSQIADDIIKFLPKGNRFCDLFGGGFAISDCAIKSHKWNSVLYNEINPLLVQLVKDAISGKYNYNIFTPQWISREEFGENKNLDGYIKYAWSFGNNGLNYLYGTEIESAKKSIHNFVVFKEKDEYIKELKLDKLISDNITDITKRRLKIKNYADKKEIQQLNSELVRLQNIERLERLQHIEPLKIYSDLSNLIIQCGDYIDYQYQLGDIVYCDPPYEFQRIDGYKGFNSQKFYEWVHTRDYPVYYSSYDNVSDTQAILVWEKDKLVLSDNTNMTGHKTECIYTNKHGIDLVKPLFKAEQLEMI